MSTDEWIKEAVHKFVVEEGDWLCSSLRKVKSVSDGRKSTAAYGFEWLIQTAFSHWLLKQSDVKDLKIGQKCNNGRKYDLDVAVLKQRVIVEIKTIAPGGISYVKSDVKKAFPKECTPYFLVFSYPDKFEGTPDLKGTSVICKGVGPESFQYYLYKKSEQGTALEGDYAALHPRQ
jgi:hypothetical protein